VTASSPLAEPAFCSVPPRGRTLGPEVADLCELIGFAPDPEQRLALDAIFALAPNGKSRVFESAVIAPRQNMKTGLFKQCVLGWLFVTDQRLIIWSAHEFSTAQESHRDLAELIEGSDYLMRRVKSIPRGNGDEGVELLSGQRVKFKARTRVGGRGLSGDKVVLDEAFALQPEHMGSLLPTLSVRPDPQVVYGSSAGLATSAVLRAIRDRGRTGNDDRLAYLEWCDDLPGECESPKCDHHPLTAKGCRMDDVGRWHRANSQLGRRMTLEFVRSERQALPPSEFGRERLGWWDAAGDEQTAIDPNLWLTLQDANAERGTEQVFAVATAPDHSWSAVAVAWRRPDGHAQVMLADYEPTTTWVARRVAELRERWQSPVITDTASRGLIEEAEEPGENEQAQAHNELARLVLAGEVHHGNQAALNTAVRGTRWKPSGNTQVLDRKGSLDISPLVAAALAVHGLGAERPSTYETKELLVL